MSIRHDLKNWMLDEAITTEKLNESVQAVRDIETHLNVQQNHFEAGNMNVAGSLTRAGRRVYDQGNKPTLAELEAFGRVGDVLQGALTSTKMIPIVQVGWNRVAVLKRNGYTQVIVSFTNNWYNNASSPTTLLVSLVEDSADIEQLYCAQINEPMAVTQARVTKENGLFYLELYYNDSDYASRNIRVSIYGTSDEDYPLALLDVAQRGAGATVFTLMLKGNALNIKGIYDNDVRVYSPYHRFKISDLGGILPLWSGKGLYLFPDGYGVYLILPSDSLSIALTRGEGIAMVYVDHPKEMTSLEPIKKCKGYIGSTRVDADGVVFGNDYSRYGVTSSGTYKVYKMPS